MSEHEDRDRPGPHPVTPAGLCETCRHVQIMRSDRGSQFYLCRLSFSDSRFRKYPPLPVRECSGYQRKE